MEYHNTVKWGFIGCGEVTEKKSGPAFGKIEGSEIVAVMSRDKEKARSYAERHGIKKYYSDDYRRTLYWNPNVTLDENGKAEIQFFNNSSHTNIEVSVNGLTADGEELVN